MPVYIDARSYPYPDPYWLVVSQRGKFGRWQLRSSRRWQVRCGYPTPSLPLATSSHSPPHDGTDQSQASATSRPGITVQEAKTPSVPTTARVLGQPLGDSPDKTCIAGARSEESWKGSTVSQPGRTRPGCDAARSCQGPASRLRGSAGCRAFFATRGPRSARVAGVMRAPTTLFSHTLTLSRSIPTRANEG